MHPGVLGKVGVVVPEGRVNDFGTFCCGGDIVVRLLGTVPPLVENCPDADEDALYMEEREYILEMFLKTGQFCAVQGWPSCLRKGQAGWK